MRQGRLEDEAAFFATSLLTRRAPGGSSVAVASAAAVEPPSCSKAPSLGFGRSSTLRKKYAPQFRGIAQNARVLHHLISLRPRQHRARLFQGRQRFGFQLKLGPQIFVRARHRAKIRRSIPACLSGVDSGTQAGTRRPSQLQPYRPSLSRWRETFAFRRRYRRGAKEGISNDQTSCRYRHFGSICSRACHGPTANGSGTGDAQER
jgi:hypothetical protein